jgi:hypothetical protein
MGGSNPLVLAATKHGTTEDKRKSFVRAVDWYLAWAIPGGSLPLTTVVFTELFIHPLYYWLGHNQHDWMARTACNKSTNHVKK